MSPSVTLQSTTLKTIASALSALLLAVGLLWAGPAVAQDGTTVSIQSQAADSGQAVDVPVTVTDFNSIGAVDLVVNYDPEVLSLADSTGLIEDAPREGFEANVAEPGELRISFFDASGENPLTLGNGTLLTLTFSEFAGGTSDLTFGAGSELADETSATIDATFEDGVVSEELATLSVGEVSDAGLNQTVSVPLSGEGLQNVGSASIELGFNDAALQFEGLANNSSGLENLQASASGGVVSIGGFNTDGTDLDSSFVEVEFSFLGGTSALTVLDGTEISDPQGSPIELASENGSVSGDAPTLSFADRNVQPGDTVSVALQASEIQELGTASVGVTFSAASLSFVGASEPITEDLQAGNPETGLVNVGFFSTDGVNPADNDGKLVDLRFAVSEQFSPGNETTLGFADGNEIANTTGTAYNAVFEEGTLTSIDRQVALGNQALDLTAGDSELQVTDIIAEAGDVVVITTDNGDGAFGDETVVGAQEVSSELEGGSLTVDVLGGADTPDAEPGDHAAHVSTDGTVGGVVATSGTAAIYGVAQFDWQDETTEGETGVVTVDAIEVLYGGDEGPETLSIDLHSVTDGSVGSFIGVSQEDLAVNEVHEDVAIDVLEPRGPGDDSERVEDVIDETGEFFAMAHLGAAGTDANGDRIPAQRPALATTVDPGTVGDFATVNLGLVTDVSRTFDNTADPVSYELVALPGAVDVDVAETVTGNVGTNWRAFLELGASDGDGALQDYADESFSFQPGNGVWVLAQEGWSFEGTIPAVNPADGIPSVALQDGWNVISNPLRGDLSWDGVQAANGLDDVGLSRWTGEGGFQSADTLRSATSGEAYYILNEAGLDSLDLTTDGSSGPASVANSQSGKADAPRTVELSATAEEAGITSTVTVGMDPSAEETSSYRAPPAHFGGTALRVTAGDPAKTYMRMVTATDTETAQFNLKLQATPGASVEVQAGDLPEDVTSDFGIVLDDGNTTYDLQDGPATVTVDEETGVANLQATLGSSDVIDEQATPDETQLRANYPNPFTRQTTIEYTMAEQSEVSVRVYNVLGQQVATLVQGTQQAGTHQVEWDGSQLSSGKYFVRMEAGGTTDTKQITVVR